MGGFLVNQTQNLIIKKEMNLEDLQMLQALTAAAQLSSAQQHATQQQQAAAAFASLSAQQSSHYSRQSTPPMSSTNSPKVSSNNTRTPTPTQNLQQNGIPNVPQPLPQSLQMSTAAATAANAGGALDPQSQSKYQQLLSVIEEMSKDIRPTYAGSKSSAERLKRGIVYANSGSRVFSGNRKKCSFIDRHVNFQCVF